MWKTKVRIADLDIEFNTKYSIRHICKGFFSEFKSSPDLSIGVSEVDLEVEMNSVDESKRVYPAYYETICLYRNLCKQLWKFNAMVLHAATFKVGERCIAFAAKSGTGKTTHLKMWQELLGDDLKIINGDKPIIRFLNNSPIAYGTPWRGKEGYGENISAQLTDICIIKRNTKNFVERISSDEILNYLFNQTILPDDSMGKIVSLGLIDKLISTCNLWVINCNLDDNAGIIAYNIIFNNGEYKL